MPCRRTHRSDTATRARRRAERDRRELGPGRSSQDRRRRRLRAPAARRPEGDGSMATRVTATHGRGPPRGRRAQRRERRDAAALPRGRASLSRRDQRRDRRCRSSGRRRRLPRARSTSRGSGRDGWFPRRNHSTSRRSSSGTLDRGRDRDGRGHAARPRAPRSTCRSTRRRARDARLKPILETLAGIPSVVIGFFALTVISPDLVQRLFGARGRLQPGGRRDRRRAPRRSPLVASVAEDAMHAVPGRAARGLVRARGARRTVDEHAGRVPGGGLRDRGRAHPRALARDRRDDGRRDRGRRRPAARLHA